MEHKNLRVSKKIRTLNKDDKQALIDLVLEQIKEDVAAEDLTAIDELLQNVPSEYLDAFMKE